MNASHRWTFSRALPHAAAAIGRALAAARCDPCPAGSRLADRLMLAAGDDRLYLPNDWSFGQLCRLARRRQGDGQSADRPTRRPACSPRPCRGGNKPLQVYTVGDQAPRRSTAPATRGSTTPSCWTWSSEFADGLRAAAGGLQRRDGPLLRGAGHVPVPHRPDRLGRDRRRGLRARVLRLELGSRPPFAGHRDLLVPGGLPEPHRLGRHRGRRVQRASTRPTSTTRWARSAASSRRWSPSGTSAATASPRSSTRR